jgi:hypothetical protein
MSHDSIVHGYIYACDDPEESRRVINTLPEQDARPHLTRDLFAIPTREHSRGDHLIAFGTIYNGVETAWEEWLEKFEALLQRLDWYEARVYLRTECWAASTTAGNVPIPRCPRRMKTPWSFLSGSFREAHARASGTPIGPASSHCVIGAVQVTGVSCRLPGSRGSARSHLLPAASCPRSLPGAGYVRHSKYEIPSSSGHHVHDYRFCTVVPVCMPYSPISKS